MESRKLPFYDGEGDKSDAVLDDAWENNIMLDDQHPVYRAVEAPIADEFEDAHYLRSTMAPVFKSVCIDEPVEHYDLGDVSEHTLPDLQHLSLNPKNLGRVENQWELRERSKLTFPSENLVANVPADGPPAAPGGYLEPHFHFTSTTPAGTLFSGLQELLEVQKELPVDFVVNPVKFKLKCVAYPQGAKLPFTIRLFSTQSQDKVAVEFQRRSGCIMAFSALYQSMRTQMHQLGLCTENELAASPSVPRTEQMPSHAAATEEQLRTTIRHLVQMAGTECVDIRVQAVHALSKLTECKDTQPILVESAMGTLVKCATSTTECVHRCAVTGLANLAEGCQHACSKLAECGGVTSVLSLASFEDTTPQVVRECARTLANVALHLKSDVLCDQFEDKIRILRSTRDSKTQRYMEQLDRCIAH